MEYSSKHDESKPSAGNPLGVYYPGSENYGLWNEPDQPNWVGHLITKYRPGPRYTPPEEPSIPGRWDDQSQDWIENPLLVNDYAMGGDTVHGVVRQVETMYLPGLGKNPPKAPWTAEETLFGMSVHRILCPMLNLCNRMCICICSHLGRHKRLRVRISVHRLSMILTLFTIIVSQVYSVRYDDYGSF